MKLDTREAETFLGEESHPCAMEGEETPWPAPSSQAWGSAGVPPHRSAGSSYFGMCAWFGVEMLRYFFSFQSFLQIRQRVNILSINSVTFVTTKKRLIAKIAQGARGLFPLDVFLWFLPLPCDYESRHAALLVDRPGPGQGVRSVAVSPRFCCRSAMRSVQDSNVTQWQRARPACARTWVSPRALPKE